MEQRIYLKCEGNKFIGFIKVGKKKLFIYDEIGCINELNPLCVLDFYVYEGCQRTGFGKELFMKMIQCERIEPRKMGYDRPSSKLISFLKKHFQLSEYVPQNNNYVVFNDYFKASSNGSGIGSGNVFGGYMPKKEQYQQYQQQQVPLKGNDYNVYSNSYGGYTNGNQKTYKQDYPSSSYSNNKQEVYDQYREDLYKNYNKPQAKVQQSSQPQPQVQSQTLPNFNHPYQYQSSSSEYGAFLNITPKKNYHYK